MPRRFASEVICSIRSDMTRTPFPAAGSDRWRGRNGSERTSSSGPRYGTFTPAWLWGPRRVGTVCGEPNGRSGGLPFWKEREGSETGEPIHHLTYRRKEDLIPNVSISPHLAEPTPGGPETASSGSFPPRSPEPSHRSNPKPLIRHLPARGWCRGDPPPDRWPRSFEACAGR